MHLYLRPWQTPAVVFLRPYHFLHIFSPPWFHMEVFWILAPAAHPLFEMVLLSLNSFFSSVSMLGALLKYSRARFYCMDRFMRISWFCAWLACFFLGWRLSAWSLCLGSDEPMEPLPWFRSSWAVCCPKIFQADKHFNQHISMTTPTCVHDVSFLTF